jgi:hypothetical protein
MGRHWSPHLYEKRLFSGSRIEIRPVCFLENIYCWKRIKKIKVKEGSMVKTQFVNYKGKRVLVEDFTNLKPGPEFKNYTIEAQAIIASQPPKSVLAVFDATGSHFDSNILNVMKEFTRANTPYIKAAAVVGITGLLQVALSAVAKFTGREFVTFKTRDEAMDWLITH